MVCIACVLPASRVHAQSGVPVGSPFASSVVSYSPGSTPASGFTDPTTALGSPERFTGEGVFPTVVSPFNPAFGTDELVSIGEGGSLTLAFDQPIVDDPANPFGVDLIVFGNAGFADGSFPDGVVTDPALAFGLDEAQIEVSADGVGFVSLGSFTEGFAPTMGWLDSGPYDAAAGSVPTDFTKPVDPSLTLCNFANLDLAQIRAIYAGSGGGTGIDIAASGLGSVSFVRISVADDNDASTFLNAEIDAVAIVPAPAAAWALLGLGGLGLTRRARRCAG